MECCGARNRKKSLQAARDEKGSIIVDPDRAASHFIAYWRKVAEEIVDGKGARDLLSQYMRELPSFRPVQKLQEVVQIVRGLPDTACGSDGVPFSAWKHAPCCKAKVDTNPPRSWHGCLCLLRCFLSVVVGSHEEARQV